MPRGELPQDLHRATGARTRQGISLSFAVCIILGPAIFLSILAYEGALADNPAPFDDDPSHHHRELSENGPLRFCTYLDEKNHIQAKAGPCDDNETRETLQKHKIAVTKDFCVEKMSNETFDIVNCSDSKILPIGRRELPTASDLCLLRNFSGVWEPTSCGEHEDFGTVGRSHLPANKPCYTTHAEGWWEPCSKPEDTVQPRENPAPYVDRCLHLEPDGTSFTVINSTCKAAQSGCHNCASISSDDKTEDFECYIRTDHENTEIVKCLNTTKHRRDGPSNDEPSNTDGGSDQELRCILIRPDGTFEDVDCNNPGSDEAGKILPSPEKLCLKMDPGQELEYFECPADSKSNPILPHEPKHVPPHLLGRATPQAENDSDRLADRPEKWTSTNRCTKNFCDWVMLPGEIRRRCYAKDDKNPDTPPMPDEALKYTAPFECNVCLEMGVHHEDRAHIERHCRSVMMQEELVFKIVVGVGGGSLLLALFIGMWFECQKRKLPFKKKPPMEEIDREQSFGTRSGRTPVLPPFDGTSNFSLLSITASQRDAPEIRLVSPPRSVVLKQGLKVPVMPTAQSVRLRTASGNHLTSPPKAAILAVETTSSPALSSERGSM